MQEELSHTTMHPAFVWSLYLSTPGQADSRRGNFW